jgi:hypothetical protein
MDWDEFLRKFWIEIVLTVLILDMLFGEMLTKAAP